jgi:predicted Zn-dependent protease
MTSATRRCRELLVCRVESVNLNGTAEPQVAVLEEQLERDLFDDRTISTASRGGEIVARRKGGPIHLPAEPVVHEEGAAPSASTTVERLRALMTGVAESVQRAGLVEEVVVRARADHRTHLYANTEGCDVRREAGWNVLGVAARHGRGPGGGRWSLISIENVDELADDDVEDRVLRELAQMAECAGGGRVEPGRYRVVLEPDVAAVFWHEALGHMMEADYANPERDDRIERRVAIEDVNVVDDPTSAGGGGRYVVDDEGTPASRTVLIEEGVLRRLLTDRNTGAAWGLESTGNGRYATSFVRPRMSNLDVGPGSSGPASDWLEGNSEALRLRWPIQGGFDGKTVAIRCWGGERTTAAGAEPIGETIVHGTPFELLAQISRVGEAHEWQRSGGLCNKGGSEGLLVGVRAPAIEFAEVACTAA